MENETVYYVLLVTITLVVAIILSIILRKILGIFIKKYSKRLYSDPTNFSFLKNSVGFVIYVAAFIFIFYKIPYLKSVGSALFAGAGIFALVVGFASQKAFSNIISGIFILLFKPFRINDVLEFKDGKKGVIEEITLRHTVIVDYENRRIIIPNSIISEETLINSSIQDERIKKHIVFSISYDSDIDKAIDIIRKEAEEHPLLLDCRTKQEKSSRQSPVIVRVFSLSDSSVDLKAYVWAKNNDEAFVLSCDLFRSVKLRFDKEGIEIPFPHRTVVMKKPK